MVTVQPAMAKVPTIFSTSPSLEDKSSDGNLKSEESTESGDPTEYPKRDFGPSHAYRIGLHLFKTTDFRCRRRVIVAAPSISSNSSQRTTREFGCQTMFNYEDHDDSDEEDDDLYYPGKKRYKTFLKERHELRKNLEAISDTKKWLLSKERTPLEEQHLLRLREQAIPLQEPVLSQKRQISSGTASEATVSLPGSRGTRSWRPKSPVGFLRKHRDSWLLQARKEFEEFKKYCMNNGITLDMERAEKALLPPPDDPSCWTALKLPLCPYTIYSEMASKEKRRLFSAQKHTPKPKRKPRMPKPEKVVLSTGACELKVLTDTWLEYQLYKRMTRAHYRSCASTHKFWPGESLHILRIPDMDPKKANSENAIFYPVNVHGGLRNAQVLSWQDNSGGHVQVGLCAKKCYHI